MDDLVSMEHFWNNMDRGKLRCLEENLTCHFFTTKPTWTAWEQTWVFVVGGQCLPDPWHGLHLFWVEIITTVFWT